MGTNIIPFGKYFIDSGKFYIDKSAFDEVLIPENFALTDTDTGQLIDEFKKSSLSIPYKNHKIYISNVVKYLGSNNRKLLIEKVLIYFPAKISDTYFFGISKVDFIGVLEYLKEIGYLKFSDTDKVFNSVHVKDLDIKMDMKLNTHDKIDIKEYNKNLKDRHIGGAENCPTFDSPKQGFGIQSWKRDRSSVTKPFFKFYDKSLEIRKDLSFFQSLPVEVLEEINLNFIYRFEFTMKDNTFFKKYGLSNRLADIFEVTQEHWKEIGKSFLNYAFNPPSVKVKDTSKLKYKDRVWSNTIWVMYQNNKMTKAQIMTIWISSANNRLEKSRGKKEFERLWSIATTPSKYTSEILNTIERVKKWDRYFGLI